MCKGILSAHSLSKIKTQIIKNCCLPMKRQRQRETKRERNKEKCWKQQQKKSCNRKRCIHYSGFLCHWPISTNSPSFPSPACSYPLLVYSTFRRGLWRHQSGWIYRPSGCGNTEKTPSRLRDLAYTEDDGDEHVTHRCGAAAGAGSF